MNVNNESKGTKADKFNGRVYHDIATVKETDDDWAQECLARVR